MLIVCIGKDGDVCKDDEKCHGYEIIHKIAVLEIIVGVDKINERNKLSDPPTRILVKSVALKSDKL
jgi:hypothetical protein